MDEFLPIKKMRWWLGLALLSLTACLLLVSDWESRLAGAGSETSLRIRTYGATGINWQSADPRLFRKRPEEDGVVSVEYGFLSLRSASCFLRWFLLPACMLGMG
jgi:hypothetical protein